MKANVEAWLHGNEDGWDDGYHDRPRRPLKDTFTFPVNWTDDEKKSYIRGYDSGFDESSNPGFDDERWNC
jgi:hypothetical protein